MKNNQKMKQLFEVNELEGKTIRTALEQNNHFLLSFTDNSFALVYCDVNEDYFSQNRAILSDYPSPNYSEFLVDLGVLTESERKANYEAMQREEQERRDRHQAGTEAIIKQRELEELERLKKKYPDA